MLTIPFPVRTLYILVSCLIGATALAGADPTAQVSLVASKATADVLPAGNTLDGPAVLLLDPTARPSSLKITLDSTLTVHRGDICVNSIHDQALWAMGARIVAESGQIHVAGGTNLMGKNVVQPPVTTGAVMAPNPLGRFLVSEAPVISREKLFISGSGDITLKPGIYDGGVFAGGGARKITLLPGTYIMRDGDCFLSAQICSGAGVTIVMVGEKPGVFWCAADTTLDLTAPAEGPLRGMVLLSRAAGSNKIQLSNTAGKLEGLIYMPAAGFALTSDCNLRVDRLVAANLSLNMGSRLDVSGRPLTLADGALAVGPAAHTAVAARQMP